MPVIELAGEFIIPSLLPDAHPDLSALWPPYAHDEAVLGMCVRGGVFLCGNMGSDASNRELAGEFIIPSLLPDAHPDLSALWPPYAHDEAVLGTCVYVCASWCVFVW